MKDNSSDFGIGTEKKIVLPFSERRKTMEEASLGVDENLKTHTVLSIHYTGTKI